MTKRKVQHPEKSNPWAGVPEWNSQRRGFKVYVGEETLITGLRDNKGRFLPNQKDSMGIILLPEMTRRECVDKCKEVAKDKRFLSYYNLRKKKWRSMQVGIEGFMYATPDHPEKEGTRSLWTGMIMEIVSPQDIILFSADILYNLLLEDYVAAFRWDRWYVRFY